MIDLTSWMSECRTSSSSSEKSLLVLIAPSSSQSHFWYHVRKTGQVHIEDIVLAQQHQFTQLLDISWIMLEAIRRFTLTVVKGKFYTEKHSKL